MILTKKELDAIKQLNNDLLSRNRARPTDEIKGEYVEEEDVKVKTKTKENANKDEAMKVLDTVKGFSGWKRDNIRRTQTDDTN